MKKFDEYIFDIPAKNFANEKKPDIQSILIGYMVAFETSKGFSFTERMAVLFSVCKFDVAAYLIHSIINDEGVSLDEITDGMFRVNYLFTDKDNDQGEPWPLVLTYLAYEVNHKSHQSQGATKKKADTSEGSQEKPV